MKKYAANPLDRLSTPGNASNPHMKKIPAILTLAALASATSVHAAWQRVSDKQLPVETASSSIKGARLVSSKGIGQSQSLISDDPTLPATLPVGASEAVIDIGRQTTANLVNFVNDGIEGKASVFSSTDKQNWAALSQAIFAPADRLVSLRFATAQARYLKIQYELVRGGSIRHLSVYGTETQQDFEFKESSSGGTTVNLASGIGGAKVIYVHPSPSRSSQREANSAIDFPESDERYRTVIYDLGSMRTLTEFGSVHSPRPVRFSVFAFEALPEKEDWRGRLSFDPKAFDGASPVAEAEDTRGVGYVKARPGKPVRARYVALRWEPDFNPPAWVVYGVAIDANGIATVRVYNDGTGEGQGQGGGQGGQGGQPPGGTTDQPGGGSGPPMSFAGFPAFSPFGMGTGGFAGGGGSLPISPDFVSQILGAVQQNAAGAGRTVRSIVVQNVSPPP